MSHHQPSPLNNAQSVSASAQAEWLRVVQEKVETLRFGVVQLVVHDGRVTQIERTEKTRLNADSRKSDSD